MVKLTICLQTNKLSVNANKSNYIVFTPRQRRQLSSSFKCGLNRCSIDQESETFVSRILPIKFLDH